MNKQIKLRGELNCKILGYMGVAVLILNLIFMFIPFVTYGLDMDGMHESYSMFRCTWEMITLGVENDGPAALIIVAVFSIPGIIYICSTVSALLSRFTKIKRKSPLINIADNNVQKRSRFVLLKLGAILNLLFIIFWHAEFKSELSSSMLELGAFCRLTFFGWLNIILTVYFIVLLFVLSSASKALAANAKDDSGKA